MQRTKAELALAEQLLFALKIASPIDGVLFLEKPQDLIGRYVQRGTYLGYIKTNDAAIVRVLIPQDEVSEVRHDVIKVSVRRAENIGNIMDAVILRELPSGSRGLPSLALSTKGGGDVVLDATSGKDPKALENWFQFDLILPDEKNARIGEKVYVRFEHSSVSLAERLYLNIRRLFLKQFSV